MTGHSAAFLGDDTEMSQNVCLYVTPVSYRTVVRLSASELAADWQPRKRGACALSDDPEDTASKTLFPISEISFGMYQDLLRWLHTLPGSSCKRQLRRSWLELFPSPGGRIPDQA